MTIIHWILSLTLALTMTQSMSTKNFRTCRLIRRTNRSDWCFWGPFLKRKLDPEAIQSFETGVRI